MQVIIYQNLLGHRSNTWLPTVSSRIVFHCNNIHKQVMIIKERNE